MDIRYPPNPLRILSKFFICSRFEAILWPLWMIHTLQDHGRWGLYIISSCKKEARENSSFKAKENKNVTKKSETIYKEISGSFPLFKIWNLSSLCPNALSWSHNLYSFTIAYLVANLSISTDKVIIQHPFTFSLWTFLWKNNLLNKPWPLIAFNILL